MKVFLIGTLLGLLCFVPMFYVPNPYWVFPYVLGICILTYSKLFANIRVT